MDRKLAFGTIIYILAVILLAITHRSSLAQPLDKQHWYGLDIVKATISVKSSTNGMPIQDARVIVYYRHGSYVKSVSGRTDGDGNVFLQMKGLASGHWQKSSRGLKGSHTIEFTVSHDAFKTVTSSRNAATRETRVYKTGHPGATLHEYTAELTAAVYMSPRGAGGVRERVHGSKWTLYGRNHCRPCTARFWVDGRLVGSVGYGDTRHLGTFRGTHTVTIGRECSGSVRELVDIKLGPSGVDSVYATLHSLCESGKVE